MLILLVCMFFANFLAVRMILRYGVETYFYDKLLVAYTVGNVDGLKMELGRIPVTDKSSLELRLAKDFTTKLETLPNPGAFLKDKVGQYKTKINLIRNLRTIAVALMLLIFIWQVVVKFKDKRKSKG